MRFVSTRKSSPEVAFSEALVRGIAPDGGLYLPVRWPGLGIEPFTGEETLPGIGARLLAPFVEDDVLAGQIGEITAEAFDFPAPLEPVGEGGRLSVLELFHGPTAAFKDFGARFLATALVRLRRGAPRPLRILVATSGDTGGAVAAAFHRRPGVEVGVLFPKGLVSPTQERQLTCWGDNVRSFAVRGTFDDCQRIVKQAFLDPELTSRFELSSANSINLGRLLPQAVYYAAASLAVWRKHREPASFVIPSGNVGNAMACVAARLMGLPIARIVLAHNANRTVPEYLESGEWRPRPSIPTLACAMDVGDPSNMERLRTVFPDLSDLRRFVSACSVDDDTIRERIRTDFRTFGRVWCPHTATAAEAYQRLPAEQRANGRWVLVATAHPAKFPETVEPLIGTQVAMPDSLAALFERPTACTEIDASLAALRAALS